MYNVLSAQCFPADTDRRIGLLIDISVIETEQYILEL